MTYVPFKSADAKWYWAPEYDFRIGESGFTVDQINAVGNTFYQIPVRLSSDNIPTARKKKNWRIANYMSKYQTHDLESYEPIEIEFSGPVIDRSWIGYLADQIVNTGAGAPFTHTCDSSSATGKSNPPRTIRLLCIEPNDYSGGSITAISLFTGVVVQEYTETGTVNGIIEGTWKVLAANEVDGNQPTTPTEYTITDFFPFAYSDIITYSKGATTYQMTFKSYTFKYKADKGHDIGGTSYYGIDSLAANTIEATLDLEFEVRDKALIAATDEDPNTAHDKTVTVKTARSATDYFSISFVKALVKFEEKKWSNGNLHVNVIATVNTKESGWKLLMTEVNAVAATRY